VERCEIVDAPPFISGGEPVALPPAAEWPSGQAPLATQLPVVFQSFFSVVLGRQGCRGSPGQRPRTVWTSISCRSQILYQQALRRSLHPSAARLPGTRL